MNRRRDPEKVTITSTTTALAFAVSLALGLTTSSEADIFPFREGQLGAPPPSDADLVATAVVLRESADAFATAMDIVDTDVLIPESFFTLNGLHGQDSRTDIDSFAFSADFVDKSSPAGAPWIAPAGDIGAIFSFAIDGTDPQTQGIVVAIVPDDMGEVGITILDNIPTFFLPDPSINRTSVVADNQGRVTVAYTELPIGLPPVVKGQRYNASGNPLGSPFSITNDAHGDVDIALLDPAGNRLIVATTDFSDGRIKGNIVDTTGPTPTVLPEFNISGTPALVHVRPQVAVNPASGLALVVWEDLTGLSGNPSDIRARRFDADGNPFGDPFTVNTVTDDAQGQPAVAIGPNGEEAIVWTGDPEANGDGLDIFTQVYDATGQPIGGQLRVNSDVNGEQSRPSVSFLATPDTIGQPQFIVTWKDVEGGGSNAPNGTGNSYKCFSIGDEDPAAIFADGFEDGDTTSWSDTISN